MPGGRGHGEPIRLFIDLEQDADIVSLFTNKGSRKFLVASRDGQGFVVNEDDCVGNTRKGKQVLNVSPPNEARAVATVVGDTVAVIGENRKMVVFALDQVPKMARGRGVRLQKIGMGGSSTSPALSPPRGLPGAISAGREFSATLKELADWRGNRADAGRLAPKGFPKLEQVWAGDPLAGRGGGPALGPLGRHLAYHLGLAQQADGGRQADHHHLREEA